MRVLMELRGRKGDMEQEMVVAYNNSVEEKCEKISRKNVQYIMRKTCGMI